MIADSGDNIINATNFSLNGEVRAIGGYGANNVITVTATGDALISSIVATGNNTTSNNNTINYEKMAAGNTLTIGSMSATGGDNRGNKNNVNVGSGNILINSSGLTAESGGQNIITAGSLSFGKTGVSTGNISASGGYTSKNIITLSEDVNMTVGNISATSGNQNPNHLNSILINTMSNNHSLTIESLSASGGMVKKNKEESGNINKISIHEGRLIISNNGIRANSGGNNIINAGSLELQGENGDIIIGNGGYNAYNTITLSGDASVGKIETNGNNNTQSINTITTDGKLVVSKSVIAKNGDRRDGKRGNENIITVNDVLGINTSKLPPSPYDHVVFADDATSNIAILADGGTNTIRANANALILGQINASNSGVNNIYIKDSNSPITNPNYIGSIYSDGGVNNIIFDGGFWMPNAITKDDGSASDKPYANSQSGKLVTLNGGTSNIIFRQGATNPLGTDIAYFVVKHSGSGESNIVMQSNNTAQHINTNMSLDYGSQGKVNVLFASENSMAQPSDESFSNATNSMDDTFFGIKYKNGVKLTLNRNW